MALWVWFFESLICVSCEVVTIEILGKLLAMELLICPVICEMDWFTRCEICELSNEYVSSAPTTLIMPDRVNVPHALYRNKDEERLEFVNGTRTEIETNKVCVLYKRKREMARLKKKRKRAVHVPLLY